MPLRCRHAAALYAIRRLRHADDAIFAADVMPAITDFLHFILRCFATPLMFSAAICEPLYFFTRIFTPCYD